MARVHLELPAHMPYFAELTVRVTDANYGGHVGNDTVLALCQEARARYLGQFGYSELDVGGVGIIVTDAVLMYRAEAFPGERLHIHVATTDYNRYGCDFLYLVRRAADAQEIARAKTNIVCFDYVRRRIAAMPADFRARTTPAD